MGKRGPARFSRQGESVRQADFSETSGSDGWGASRATIKREGRPKRLPAGDFVSPLPDPHLESTRAQRSVNIGWTQDTANRTAGLDASRDILARESDLAASHPVPGSGVLGIWRLGQSVHDGEHSRLWTAQPADAPGNTRWDYLARVGARSAGQDREKAIQSLRRFADAAAAAQDPHLISVLDASLDSAEPFLVMPRLPGRSLRALLTEAGEQPLAVALWWIRQTAQATAALHRAGYCHGDIRPENIWVSPRGTATLIDLGSAAPTTPSPVSLASVAPAEDSNDSPAIAGEHRFESSPPAADDMLAIGRVMWELLASISIRPGQETVLGSIADLVAESMSPELPERPTAADWVRRLNQLELDSLNAHIRPSGNALAARAA